MHFITHPALYEVCNCSAVRHIIVDVHIVIYHTSHMSLGTVPEVAKVSKFNIVLRNQVLNQTKI